MSFLLCKGLQLDRQPSPPLIISRLMQKHWALLIAVSMASLMQHSLLADALNPAITAPALEPAPLGQAPTASAGAGLANDWLRDESFLFNPWDLGGQFRARLEIKDNFATPGQPGQVDFRKNGGDANNTYLLLRQRVHVGYNSDWFSAFVEGQESSSTGDKRNPNLESDLFDLHQAYVNLGNLQQFPLTAKVGRQELAYGDERLVGAFDWNNIGRVFDAVKLRYQDENFWVDTFASRVVIPRDNEFDTSNDYDFLSGIYGSTRNLLPWQDTQIYFLARNVSEGSPNFETGALVPLASPRDIYTPGFRLKSLPGQLAGWDYTLEAAYQFGRFAGVSGAAPAAVVGKSFSHEAYAAHLDGGYTWTNVIAAPRLGFEANYASGDSDPNDDKHGTFDTLFPTGHAFSGVMDFYSWQNIQDVRINLILKPIKKLTVATSFRGVWLADTADSFYQANTVARSGGTVGGHDGYAKNPGYDSFVGTELDLLITYSVMKFATVQGGYGHFFIGDYVKQSFSGGIGSTDADYVYLQAKIVF